MESLTAQHTESGNSLTTSSSKEHNDTQVLLPYELWRMIAHNLDYHDLTKLRRVSKLFRSIIQALDFDDAMFRVPLPKEVYSSPSSSNHMAPKSADVDMLTSTGFPRSRCIKALVIAGNNVAIAADWLFSHSEDVDTDVQVSEINNPVSTGNTNNYPVRAPVHFVVLRRQGELAANLLPAGVHTLHPILADVASWMDVEAPPIFYDLLSENLGMKEPFEVWTLWDIAILENLGAVTGPFGEALLARLHGLYTAQEASEHEQRANVLLGKLLYALKEQAIVPPLPEWRSVHIQYDAEDIMQARHLIEGDSSTVGDFLRVVLEQGIINNAAYWESLEPGCKFRGFRLEDTHRASMLNLVPEVVEPEFEQVDVESDDGELEDAVSDEWSEDEESDDESAA